jgi:hypothetical protein
MLPYERIWEMADTASPRPGGARRSDTTRSATAWQPRPPRLRPSARLGVGVVVLLLGLVVFGGSRVVAAGERHAYDKGAVPPATYHLTAGKDYQLSAPGGVAALTKAGLLATGDALNCRATDSAGVETRLSIQSTKDDERSLTQFATFEATKTGSVHVSCAGLTRVFVDDADDAGSDVAGGLMVLSIVLAFIGVAAIASGGYAISEGSVAHDTRTSQSGASPYPAQPSNNL